MWIFVGLSFKLIDDESKSNLNTRHSFCAPRVSSYLITTDNCCESDINFPRSRQIKRESIVNNLKNLGEYYKRYEHDEVPVKDSKFYDYTDIGDQKSLTNSELDKLELKIFKNISQELQTDDNSLTSLESNIKFFKTTVQEIFDNFYANMRDFDLYKKRFYEILAKNDTEAIADMEDFIKDMIQHIMSSRSDTSISNDSKKSDCSNKSDVSLRDDLGDLSIKTATHSYNLDDTITLASVNKSSDTESQAPKIEVYKNEVHQIDSTINEKKAKTKDAAAAKEEVFNIFLLSGNPCVQIKMNDRILLSEINIKDPSKCIQDGKNVASADNMVKVAAKKMELKKYVEQAPEDGDMSDREIPVKVSYAKKNIHLNEDFSHERESEKSFITKICNFLCRRFRKA